MPESSVTALSVVDAAATRRAIRTYTPAAVPRADLEQILHAVSLAPSAFNTQPWRFQVIETPALKAQLAAVANNQRQVTSAPAVIVLYTDMADVVAHADDVVHPNLDAEARRTTVARIVQAFGSKSDADREQWGAEQGNIALGYLLLAAASLGYQTSPMAGFDAAGVKALLGIPAHARVVALVAIGKGAEDGFPHHRHPLSRIATFR